MDMRIPPLGNKIVLESNPLKSIMLAGKPGVLSRGTEYEPLAVLAHALNIPYDMI